MPMISPLDAFALLYFVAAWFAYSVVIERSALGKQSLNALMNAYRERWMLEMLARPVRIVDSQVTASLQNGTAFFASTSLIAVGGALTLLKSTEEILTVVAVIPFAGVPTRALWEAKMLGLALIFVYAFFKFAWAYRLFNYVSILIGAAPPPEDKKTVEARKLAHRAAEVCSDAGRHFNRGQRAFFFALGYLGWFLGPVPLILTTTCTVLVMYRRQFHSQSRHAFAREIADVYPPKRGSSKQQ
jgi:uncharacterized membrane protein